MFFKQLLEFYWFFYFQKANIVQEGLITRRLFVVIAKHLGPVRLCLSFVIIRGKHTLAAEETFFFGRLLGFCWYIFVGRTDTYMYICMYEHTDMYI